MPSLWSERQKKHGVKLVLGWFKPRNCWKKYRNGVTRYFQHPNSKAGYEAALLEFQSWCRQQDGLQPWVPEYRHHRSLLQQSMDWWERFGVPEDEDGHHDEVARLLERIEVALEDPDNLKPLPLLLPTVEVSDADTKALSATERNRMQFLEEFTGRTLWQIDGREVWGYLEGSFAEYCELTIAEKMKERGFGRLGYQLPEKWKERLRQLQQLGDASKKRPQTVAYWIARYTDFKADQARGNELGPTTLRDRKQKLRVFETWIKPGTHVSTINESTVRDYYRHQLRQTYEKITKGGYFSAFRMWMKWAWRQEECELENLPRNLDDRELRFSSHIDKTGRKRTRTEQLWTPDEVTKMLTLPEPWPCWLVLMLNCGFTQADLNQLRHDELRMNEGRIVRQRTKTRRCPDPPIVSYRLWDKSIELLQLQISDHPDFVLQTTRGTRLIKSEVDDEGNVKGHDNVSRHWQSVRKKSGLAGKQLKILRKTGSTTIRRNPEYCTMDALYLGESWKNIPDRHYNAHDGEPYPPLDEAIQWLGEEFKLTSRM